MAQNLDPNSHGRGVLQFKTGLTSVIKVLVMISVFLVIHYLFLELMFSFYLSDFKGTISSLNYYFRFAIFFSKNLLRRMGFGLIAIVTWKTFGSFIFTTSNVIEWMTFNEKNRDCKNLELLAPHWESMSCP